MLLFIQLPRPTPIVAIFDATADYSITTPTPPVAIIFVVKISLCCFLYLALQRNYYQLKYVRQHFVKTKILEYEEPGCEDILWGKSAAVPLWL